MIKRKKYQDGTKGIKKGPGGDVERATPSVDPPAEDTSLDSYSPDLPQVRTSPTSSSTGLAKGGTEYVAAFQRKLNSQGANLAVDGAWGEKTQAAFEQYQKGAGKKILTANTSTLPKRDKEFKSVSPKLGPSYRELAGFYDQKQRKTKDASPSFTYDPDYDDRPAGTTTEDAYEQIIYPQAVSPRGEVSKVGARMQFYPNGRVRTPSGKMDTYSKLPRRKPEDPTKPHFLTPQDLATNQAKETARVSAIQKAREYEKNYGEHAMIEKARASGNTREFNRLVNLKAGKQKG